MWLFCFYWEGLRFELPTICVYVFMDYRLSLSNDNILVLVSFLVILLACYKLTGKGHFKESSRRQIEDLNLLNFVPNLSMIFFFFSFFQFSICFTQSS